MSDKIITIDQEQLRILYYGLHTWNTICLDSLTKEGQKKIFDAQDLIERIREENA